jgi:8-oxo-dGTP pyrophosphatase MutT (NUDIX family)
MSGAFQKSDLPVISAYITTSEVALLRDILVGKRPWREVCIGAYNADIETRFYSQAGVLRPYVQRHCAQVNNLTSTPWTFPKGRMDGNESPYKCALREFEEESGLPASLLGVPVLPDIISETYVSFDRFVYETRCWVFCVPTEPTLVQPGPNEIAERRWCTQAEAETLLSPSKYAMLRQAKSRIDSEILDPRTQKPTYLPDYGEHIQVQREESDRSPAEEPHREG